MARLFEKVFFFFLDKEEDSLKSLQKVQRFLLSLTALKHNIINWHAHTKVRICAFVRLNECIVTY